MEDIISTFKKHKIIPVIAIENIDHVLPLTDALIEGNLPLIEITFRTQIAIQAINQIRSERPDVMVGAGTVLTIDELHAAKEYGAAFAVAPGLNQEIVAEAQNLKFPFFPGIMTPSDLETALSMNCHICKFFPSEASGGLKYIRSAFMPYMHKNIQLIPTGGINLTNLVNYLSSDIILAVGGTWIARKEEIERNNWTQIIDNCLKANNKMSEISST
jgi:2-dehydro-3-deoxyphosphogluconate aldolase/(4S)-4-hydroxy-2-oxoglutarate aldolase